MSIWTQLQADLPGHCQVAHWSARKGNLNQSFTVMKVDRRAIDIETGSSTSRRISQQDFERIEQVFTDYCGHKVPRSKLTDISVNSTYILSLLHWWHSHHDDPSNVAG
jgi:hypothetical protein